MKELTAAALVIVITIVLASCSGRQLEVVNESTVKVDQVTTGTLYDASVIFVYDGENIGRVHLGDIPVGKSVKVDIPTKAEKVALSWCFVPKEHVKGKEVNADIYALVKELATVMLPNFTYLEEKGNTRIVVDDKTYSKMVQ